MGKTCASYSAFNYRLWRFERKSPYSCCIRKSMFSTIVGKEGLTCHPSAQAQMTTAQFIGLEEHVTCLMIIASRLACKITRPKPHRKSVGHVGTLTLQGSPAFEISRSLFAVWMAAHRI
ncbi:hypothetical protein AVEN_107409-1 [Araneus ventricosus]|uniref:Uncharacterized protein n=1 Tax=Araneus ventricosus TaxID=182803 RepID=A0A4Y2NNS0_ARAVE|nr:hypothetical protein AVEN_107409-1 [Araneus ventricosus]